jgi:hypothetical protein
MADSDTDSDASIRFDS